MFFPQLKRNRAGQQLDLRVLRIGFQASAPLILPLPQNPHLGSMGGGGITASPNQQPKPRQETEEVDRTVTI